MPTTQDDVLTLADRFISAVAAGDIETVRSIYAPDAVIWHNMDGKEVTVDENLVTLQWMASNMKGLRYTDVRCQATTSGYVEQHVLRAIAPNGAEFVLPACLVVTVDGGRITRLEEYFDSAALAPLTS